MRGRWAIPVMFTILLFSTTYSAQTVYGPHYTSMNGLQYNFQGTGQATFDVFFDISTGLANPKKDTNFEICVTLETATDTRTVPIEIVALDLVSCQPITVLGESDEKNFFLATATFPIDPISVPSGIADIFGSYEIVNPAGQPMAGTTVIDEKDVVLDDISICVPPTCTSSCGEHGTCVADDVCVCDDGFHGDLCTVPDCTSNEECNDGNSCTLNACQEGQCVAAPISGCIPGEQCTSNEQCIGPDECTVGFCDSTGNCQFAPIPGCTSCIPSGTEICDGLDNDCDGGVDEDYALGAPCFTGEGACQSLGNLVCNSSGDGTVCSAILGTPVDETCDGLDNDCDGIIDNDVNSPFCELTQGVCAGSVQSCSGAGGFGACGITEYGVNYEPTEIACDGLDNDCDGTTDDVAFHPLCSTQLGVCAGSTKTCAGSSGFQTCGATEFGPNYESAETTCDGLDNDCDGVIDNGFLNNGKYDLDTACGSCFTDCTEIFDKPNAFGTCDSTTATPVCQLTCSPGFLNVDGNPENGCETSENPNAIHVSKTGSDSSSCGSISNPCATISNGIARAVTNPGITEVHVASGIYQESITLANRISVLGGYNPLTWESNPLLNPTIIQGNDGSTHKTTVSAVGIVSPTTFSGFTVYGQNNPTPSGNSYAVYVKDSDDALRISDNTIISGSGGSGSHGAIGNPGMDGVNGGPGTQTTNFESDFGVTETYFDLTECQTGLTNLGGPILGGTGGSKIIDITDVSGGDGGTAFCADFDMISGNNGFGGNGPFSGAGGLTGYASRAVFQGDGCETSQIIFKPTNGENGLDGANGVGGSACTAPSGNVISNHWVGFSGQDGQTGALGSGGGGGGTSAGMERFTFLNYELGATGGGGGSGAAGGVGGAGGSSGGGSFGIFVVQTSTPTTVPVITNNDISLGNGGNGGFGGNGGIGGHGGLGGLGGQTNPNTNFAEVCMLPGGNGGNGGNGGHGAGAGGGCGGVSYGIFSHGHGGFDLSSWSTGNNFVTIGVPGNGGIGGFSAGSLGGNGQTGIQSNTNFP